MASNIVVRGITTRDTVQVWWTRGGRHLVAAVRVGVEADGAGAFEEAGLDAYGGAAEGGARGGILACLFEDLIDDGVWIGLD